MKQEHPAIKNLRKQPFYRGQIRSIHALPERPSNLDCSIGDVPLDSALPSLSILSRTLYGEGLFPSVQGAVRLALENNQSSDVHVLSPPGSERRQFIFLITLLEIIDLGGYVGLIVKNGEAAQCLENAFKSAIEALDFYYAVSVLCVRDKASAQGLVNRLDQVIIFPQSLFCSTLISSSKEAESIDRWLRTVSRWLIIDSDEWSSEQLAHTALAFRYMRCRTYRNRGKFCTSALTINTPDAQTRLSRLIGKPVLEEEIVQCDDAALSGGSLVVYSSPLIAEEGGSRDRWVKQPSQEAFGDLIEYLVGKPSEIKRHTSKSLHYLIDRSGSMAQEPLEKVKLAVAKDFDLRCAANATVERRLSPTDEVSIAWFDEKCGFSLQPKEVSVASSDFLDALNSIQSQGSTDPVPGLHLILEAISNSTRAHHTIIILTDGGFSVTKKATNKLLDLIAEIRASGKEIDLFYVALDFDPPAQSKQFIKRLSGEIVDSGFDDIGRDLGEIGAGSQTGKVVVLDGSDSSGISFTQRGHGGIRDLLVINNPDAIEFYEEDIFAIVCCGWLGSYSRMVELIARLGRGKIPVFFLVEADSRTIFIQEGPEFSKFQLRLSGSPFPDRNPYVSRRWLTWALATGPLSASEVVYLSSGYEAYNFLANTEENPNLARIAEVCLRGLPFRHFDGLFHILSKPAFIGKYTFSSMTDKICVLSDGQNFVSCDRSTAPIRFHRGSVHRLGKSLIRSNESPKETKQELSWTMEDRWDKVIPDIVILGLKQQVDTSNDTSEEIRLGRFTLATVEVVYGVKGFYKFPRGNLEGNSSYDPAPEPLAYHTFQTEMLTWEPLSNDVSPELLVDLLGILLEGLKSVFRDLSAIVLPVADAKQKKIHLLDLAPGGNGTTRSIFEHLAELESILAIGTWATLLCPCESNLEGTTLVNQSNPAKCTCPRCSGGFLTSVGLPEGGIMPADHNKQASVDWIIQRTDILPETTAEWLDRKTGSGLNLREHYQPSSRSLVPTPIANRISKIYRDRLGLELSSSDLAKVGAFLNPTQAAKGNTGQYHHPPVNEFRFAQGLREWMALDVYAHELFHNFQLRMPGLFAESLRDSSVPHKGLLFVEGSAVWAESHAVEALAIRTSLRGNNLRQGDEYGDGFKMMKFIEEEFGGVSAVFDFLATGDIARISNGRYSDLESFWKDFISD